MTARFISYPLGGTVDRFFIPVCRRTAETMPRRVTLPPPMKERVGVSQ